MNTRPGQPSNGSVSLLIGHALADNARNGLGRALRVSDLECRALVVAEVKLCQIPLQVLLRHVVVSAGDAALEDAE